MDALLQGLTNMNIREGDAGAELLFLFQGIIASCHACKAAKVMRVTGLLMDIPISGVVSGLAEVEGSV
jgi:hypothetical protein